MSDGVYESSDGVYESSDDVYEWSLVAFIHAYLNHVLSYVFGQIDVAAEVVRCYFLWLVHIHPFEYGHRMFAV